VFGLILGHSLFNVQSTEETVKNCKKTESAKIFTLYEKLKKEIIYLQFSKK